MQTECTELLDSRSTLLGYILHLGPTVLDAQRSCSNQNDLNFPATVSDWLKSLCLHHHTQVLQDFTKELICQVQVQKEVTFVGLWNTRLRETYLPASLPSSGGVLEGEPDRTFCPPLVSAHPSPQEFGLQNLQDKPLYSLYQDF